jgi:DNA-directed RNA polymerase specialized sigma24 family protein
VSDDGFEDFVAVRYRQLLRTAYLLTGAQHAAEDLLQTVLLKAMRRWSRIDEPVAYLRRAMVNQSASRWRRLGRRTELLTATVPDRPAAGDSADNVAARDELLTALACSASVPVSRSRYGRRTRTARWSASTSSATTPTTPTPIRVR